MRKNEGPCCSPCPLRILTSTRRIFVDTTDPAAIEAATSWWEQLTAAGGEGMVVKPAQNLTRGRNRLVRVHECVFAVLACESEPVDPRL